MRWPKGETATQLLPEVLGRDVAVHLNCGIAGTLIFGGGSGGIPAFLIPLGFVTLPCAAPIIPGFGRNPPAPAPAIPACPAPTEPPPRANEAAGAAKIRSNAIAGFILVFDIGSSVRRIAPNAKLMLLQ